MSSLSLSLVNDVKKAFALAIVKAFPSITLTVQPVVVSSQPKFGDYQCNSAMSLFKNYETEIKNAKSPFEVAQMIDKELSRDLFKSVEIAKQGFITVRLATNMLKSRLVDELKPKKEMETAEFKKLSCLVDYSSPNIAKEMHVGHLRSTIIGESICRLLEFVGHSVLRVNHIGDWGTQFGMLIEYMRERYPNFQQDPPRISDMTEFYREAKKRFDEDLNFKTRSRFAVTKLQSGVDEFAKDAWVYFCKISEKEFQQIYDRFGVTLIKRGESYYNDMLPLVVAELEEKKFIQDSDGAKVVFVENDDVPLMIVKSDGGYGYDTTDIAAVKHRLTTEHHDWVIYVTDVGQEHHFSKVFKVAKMMEWFQPGKNKLDHVGFGLVQGQDGKKFKTRSGDLVKLVDLLDEAVERASAELHRRRAEEQQEKAADTDGDGGGGVEPVRNSAAVSSSSCSAGSSSACGGGGGVVEDLVSIDVAAKAIGYSAIRYFDLKQHRMSNYKFSYDKMLDSKGNTAVYMLYAYARICAIFRKAGVDPHTLNIENLQLNEAEERSLAFEILKFYEVVNNCLEDFCLHRIAEYMYSLSTIFTLFYQNCKIVGSAQQESRLLLCELTRIFLKKSFYLFGISPLERI